MELNHQETSDVKKQKGYKRYGKYAGKVCGSEVRIASSSTFAFDVNDCKCIGFPTEDEAIEYLRNQGAKCYE